MSNSYPRKYWWVVLIVVPLVAGLIAIIPKFRGGSGESGHRITIEKSDVGGDVQIIDKQEIIGTQVIINQIEESSKGTMDIKDLEARITQAVNLAKDESLKPDAIPLFEEIIKQVQTPALYNNLGTLYLSENRYDQAGQAFKKGIAIDPSYQPLRKNLAKLYQKEGKIGEAIVQLEKAPNEAVAQTLLASLREKVEAGLIEREPNNDFQSPNEVPLAKNIQAAINERSDQDTFKFIAPGPPRDILRIEVKNLSNYLKLRVELRNAQKNPFWANAGYAHQVAGGQDIIHEFSSWPHNGYYLSISSFKGKGKYHLSIFPQNSFDSHEPNDNYEEATNINFDSSTNANLMDSTDQDFFRVLPSSHNNISISLKNRSLRLQPKVELQQSDGNPIWANAGYAHQVNPGQSVNHSESIHAGKTYYLIVSSLEGHGEYSLSVTKIQ